MSQVFLKACSLVQREPKAKPLGRVASVLSFEEAKVLRASGQVYMNAALQDYVLMESPIPFCGENHINDIIVPLCFQVLIQMIAVMDELKVLSNISTHLPQTCQP